MSEQGRGSRVCDAETKEKTWEQDSLLKERENGKLRGHSRVARHDDLDAMVLKGFVVQIYHDGPRERGVQRTFLACGEDSMHDYVLVN